MTKPIEQMTEIEFAEHIEKCHQIARENSWTHVIENTFHLTVKERERIEMVRRSLKELDKTLKEI